MRVLAVALLALAASAPSAAAGTVQVTEGQRVTLGADDTPSAMTAALVLNPDKTYTVTVHDDDAVLVPGPGCTAQGEHDAVCRLDQPYLEAALGGGDDTLTILAPSGDTRWAETRLTGGDGNDALDTTAIDALERDGVADGVVVGGGAGNDALRDGDTAALLRGGSGDDTLTGGGRNDLLEGDAGVDRQSGGGGRDSMQADADDTLLDGGPDNDFLQAGGISELTCGPGRDQVSFKPDSPPGTLVGPDCEDAFNFLPSPVARTRSTLTFEVSCSNAPKCTAQLRLRWREKVVARQRFSSRSDTPKRVTLTLPRALRRAREPQLIALEIHGFRDEYDEFLDPRVVNLFWRVRV